ncbi:hypothetical protein ACW9H6_28835 [Pseudomonas sp. SDO528_S397]
MVGRMNLVCTNFSNSKHKGLRETSKFVEKMDTLARNFDEIFKELNEDVQKAIVRMHWQEMYMSELKHAMNAWNILDLVHDLGVRIDNADRLKLVFLKKIKRIRERKIDPFAEYLLIKEIINREDTFPVLSNTTLITQDYLFFEMAFFHNESLSDHLYGYINAIDARIKAPTLTALNEFFHEDLKNIILEQKKDQANEHFPTDRK